jgi:hypothetical protein
MVPTMIMLIGGNSWTASVRESVPQCAFVHRAPPLPLGVQRGRAALHVGRVLRPLRVQLLDLACMLGLCMGEFGLAISEPSLRTGERGLRVGGGGAVLRGGGDRRANVGQLRQNAKVWSHTSGENNRLVTERYFHRIAHEAK